MHFISCLPSVRLRRQRATRTDKKIVIGCEPNPQTFREDIETINPQEPITVQQQQSCPCYSARSLTVSLSRLIIIIIITHSLQLVPTRRTGRPVGLLFVAKWEMGVCSFPRGNLRRATLADD